MTKVGALWLRESKKGNKFMSGNCNDVKIIVFKNGKKDNEKQPDYLIYLQEEKKDEEVPF